MASCIRITEMSSRRSSSISIARPLVSLIDSFPVPVVA